MTSVRASKPFGKQVLNRNKEVWSKEVRSKEVRSKGIKAFFFAEKMTRARRIRH